MIKIAQGKSSVEQVGFYPYIKPTLHLQHFFSTFYKISLGSNNYPSFGDVDILKSGLNSSFWNTV